MNSPVVRIVVYFVGMILAILLPVGGALLYASFGPPPYVLRGAAPASEWKSPRTYPDGSVVTVSRFVDASAAERGVETLLKGIAWEGETVGVRRYRRDNGRHGLIFPVGNYVIRVEAADDAAVEARLASLPFVAPNPQRNWLRLLVTEHATAACVGLVIYLLLYTVAMFRGGAWAARVSPQPGVPSVPLETLRQRLFAINKLDVPFRVTEEKHGRLVAEWRIADARWVDLMGAGGLRIAHRIHLRLDPATLRVRALTVQRSIGWGAGIAGLSWVFSYFRGISFFDYQRAEAIGLVYKNGNWTLDFEYRYRFLLSEIQTPLVEAITRSGWTFAPVMTFFRPLGG
jgi:hypothetical protein